MLKKIEQCFIIVHMICTHKNQFDKGRLMIINDHIYVKVRPKKNIKDTRLFIITLTETKKDK